MKATLFQHGLNSIQVDEVLRFSDKNDYQLACAKHFEFVNDHKATDVINSPNRYFELTQMIKQIKSKQTDATSVNDRSLNDSLYDKHLWEMLSPTKENFKMTEMTAEPMSQLDLNF